MLIYKCRIEILIIFSKNFKVYTGLHSLITTCQTHQQENNCTEIELNDEKKCKQIFSDCESLFVTMLSVYKNDINARDEKGKSKKLID